MPDRRSTSFALALLLLAAPVAAEVPASPPGVTVADLAWIAGQWRGDKDGSLIDEHWSAPAAGTMMGMFRWTAGGKVRLYEFMVVEAGDTGPVLRLKHFSPGLEGWEEKGESLAFYLVRHAEGRAEFAMDPAVEPTRLVYQKTEGGGLSVQLIKTKDGEERVTEFLYSRQ